MAASFVPHIYQGGMVNRSVDHMCEVDKPVLPPKSIIKPIFFYYCNARSLRCKLTDLHDLLCNGQFQVICFTESWLD